MFSQKKTQTLDSQIEKEVKLFADPENADMLNFLHKIAPNTTMVKEVKRQKTDNYIEKKRSEIYSGFENFNAIALTKENLLEECIKYNKIFIPISEYTGSFTVEDTKNIKTFCEKNNLAVSDTDYDKLYVLVDRELNKITERHDSFKTKQQTNPVFLIKYTGDKDTNGDIYFPIGYEKKGFDLKSWFRGMRNMTPFSLGLSFASLVAIASLVVGNMIYAYIPLYVPFVFLIVAFLVPMGLWKNTSNTSVFKVKENYTYPYTFRDNLIFTAICMFSILFTFNVTNNLSLLLRGESGKMTYTSSTDLNSKEEVEKYNRQYNSSKKYRVEQKKETEYTMGLFLPSKTKVLSETVYEK